MLKDRPTLVEVTAKFEINIMEKEGKPLWYQVVENIQSRFSGAQVLEVRIITPIEKPGPQKSLLESTSSEAKR